MVSINQRQAIRKIEEQEIYICNARSLLLSGNIDAREYYRLKQDCETKIKILKTKIDESVTSLAVFENRLKLMYPAIFSLAALFEKIDVNNKKRLIALLAGKTIVWIITALMIVFRRV